MFNYNEVKEHIHHNLEPERVILNGDEYKIVQYCKDCDKEIVVETDQNTWKLADSIRCPGCGMPATESVKYVNKDGKVLKRHWKHCFNCNFTEEYDEYN